MSHFLSTAALIGTVTLITAAPIKGEASTTPSHMTHKLLELKRKNEENTRKINQLEHRLNNTNSRGNLRENSYNWPERYMHIPQTNSAVQLVLNPNIAMSYDFNPFAGDFISAPNLSLSKIDPNASRSGRFNTQARATQFGIRTLSHTNIGEVKSEINFDFYGTSDPTATGVPVYQPRLRFAFIEFLGLTIGQTTSNFLDLDAIGETVDYGTIMGGSFRHALVQYAFNFNKQTSLSLAAERSITDYTDAIQFNTNNNPASTANSACSLPDLTAKLKYADSFGHVALRGVWRELKVKNYANNVGAPSLPQTLRKIGWGLGLSAKFFIHKKSNLFAQVNFGNGIGRFTILGNGQSAFYNPLTGIFDTQKIKNYIIGLEHIWTESLRSNLIYGRTEVSVSKYTPIPTIGLARATKSMNQLFLNLIYAPIPSLDLGIEYGYADRTTADSKRGKANRITGGAVYRF
ncbi:MAG: DcaP family trimeric outer membrane transporter [Candidatus Paracaedibacter sp.]